MASLSIASALLSVINKFGCCKTVHNIPDDPGSELNEFVMLSMTEHYWLDFKITKGNFGIITNPKYVHLLFGNFFGEEVYMA